MSSDVGVIHNTAPGRQGRRRRARGCSCGRALALLATAAGLSYLLILLYLQHGVPEDRLPAFLAVYLPQPPLLVPLACVCLLCLMLWQWRLLAFNAAVLAVAVWLTMPAALPGRRPPDDPQRRIRIVTWNTHEEYEQTDRMRKAIAELKPDIVCLQEARRGQFYELLPGAEVAHTHEVTTLTRGRIVASEALPLGDYPNFRWGMDTTISLPQGQVRVFNVHYVIDVMGRVRAARRGEDGPTNTQLARANQNRAVLQWLDSTAGPRAVAGDFNTPPRVHIYRQLAARATDSFAAAGRGWGFTYRRDHPMIRIDYIWTAGGLRPLRSFTRDGGASDHRLVVTDVLLPAASRRPAAEQTPPGRAAAPERPRSERRAPAAHTGAPEDTR